MSAPVLAITASANFRFTVVCGWWKNLPFFSLIPIRGPLFPDSLRDKRTRKMMELDLKAAGLAFKTEVWSQCFHALRNTFISQLFDAGLTINQVQHAPGTPTYG
jgi:hypothetical protein